MHKMKFYFFFVFTFLFASFALYGQSYDCNFSSPVLKIDFGTLGFGKDFNLSTLKNYSKKKSGCPNDGEYSFTNYSSNCFDGKWHIISEDHTIGDENGKMMVVNASQRPSIFFNNYIAGLTPGKHYEFSFWVVNICKFADGCLPTPPIIKTSFFNGKNEVANFQTGFISQTASPVWKLFYGDFTVPQDASMIVLQMEDVTIGGCGNDFAIDDIVLKECKKETPKVVEQPKAAPVIVAKELPKPILVLPKEKVKPVVETGPQKIEKTIPVLKPLVEKKVPVTVSTKDIKPITIDKKEKTIVIPKILLSRDNEVARKIETEETEMVIELYDNGDIDGDTVTIYHNNQIIANHAGLSSKPITLKIKINKNEPHHELVMVADNLGSIPPNTSLMIITANKKRYEVYISSTDKKNAKVIIDLKE
jgi:hypothetical protein